MGPIVSARQRVKIPPAVFLSTNMIIDCADCILLLTAADMISDVSPGTTVLFVIVDGWTKSARTTVVPRGGRGAAAKLAATASPILGNVVWANVVEKKSRNQGGDV